MGTYLPLDLICEEEKTWTLILSLEEKANVSAFHHISQNIKLNRLNQNTLRVMNLLSDKDERYKMKDKAVSLLKTAFSNIKNDLKSFRNRDSIVIIQFMLTFFCIFGMPLFIAYCVQIFGFISILTGLYFIIKGMWDLNENLSLSLVPVRNNVVISTGLYKQIRHPIYSGLILSSFGISILSNNVEKFVLSILLCYLTNYVVDIEESALIDRHDEYRKYREITVYKFVPNFV